MSNKYNAAIKKRYLVSSIVSFGATGGIRTPDRSVRSRVLYPAELQLHKLRDYNITFFAVCQ